VKYNLAEIDAERRTGYAWYQPRPLQLLEKEYPKWAVKWLGKTLRGPQRVL
jgi:hypothetical protein